MRQQTVLQTDEMDVRVLEPFGGVDGDERDRVAGFLVRLAFVVERGG